jgi:hypothetical protein
MRIELARKIHAASAKAGTTRRVALDGGAHQLTADGPVYVGSEQLPATQWLNGLLLGHIGRNVRVTFEELPMESRL